MDLISISKDYKEVKKYVQELIDKKKISYPIDQTRMAKAKDYSVGIWDNGIKDWVKVKYTSKLTKAYQIMIQLKKDFNIPISSYIEFPPFLEDWSNLITENLGYVYSQVKRRFERKGLKPEYVKATVHELIWFFLHYKATSYDPLRKSGEGHYSMLDWFTQMVNIPSHIDAAYRLATNTDTQNGKEMFNNGGTNERMFGRAIVKHAQTREETTVLDRIDQLDCKDGLLSEDKYHRKEDEEFVRGFRIYIKEWNTPEVPNENQMLINLLKTALQKGNTNQITTDSYKLCGSYHKHCIIRLVFLFSEYYYGDMRLYDKYTNEKLTGVYKEGSFIELFNN